MAVEIQNPTLQIRFAGPEEKALGHIHEVVHSFPNEYRVVESATGSIVVLHTPLQADNIGKDILFRVNLRDGFDITVTNETGALSSYNEQSRNQGALSTFGKLLEMSISGSLKGVVDQQNNQAASTAAQATVLNMILALLGLALAVYGASILFS